MKKIIYVVILTVIVGILLSGCKVRKTGSVFPDPNSPAGTIIENWRTASPYITPSEKESPKPSVTPCASTPTDSEIQDWIKAKEGSYCWSDSGCQYEYCGKKISPQWCLARRDVSETPGNIVELYCDKTGLNSCEKRLVQGCNPQACVDLDSQPPRCGCINNEYCYMCSGDSLIQKTCKVDANNPYHLTCIDPIIKSTYCENGCDSLRGECIPPYPSPEPSPS